MAKKKPNTERKGAVSGRGIAGRILGGLIGGILLFGVLWSLKDVFWESGSSARPVFNAKQAFFYLEQQCRFGPRIPGSKAHQQCGDFLVAELKKYCERVVEQRFSYDDKNSPGRRFQGRNIIASVKTQPKRDFRVMLCAHWDSRSRADKDPDPQKHDTPVLGANDGASGVAVLLEIARILKENPLDFGVDIVLFDLEDQGDYRSGRRDRSPGDSLNPFCIGSRYFAKHLGNYRPEYGILLDMVGKKNLAIKKEGYSYQYAPLVIKKVWQAARKVKAAAFKDEFQGSIEDDHLALLNKGIPVINLIDFDYPHWHTTADTPDKCSPESLQQVGEVLIEVIYCE